MCSSIVRFRQSVFASDYECAMRRRLFVFFSYDRTPAGSAHVVTKRTQYTIQYYIHNIPDIKICTSTINTDATMRRR